MNSSHNEHSGQSEAASEETILVLPASGEPWMPFDAGRRQTFLDALRNGVRSHRMACKMLRLNRSTVTRWIKRGKDLEDADPEGEPYRRFVIELQAAEAERDSRVDVLLHKAAPLDWRASDALAKRQERQALYSVRARTLKAEAAIAEANVLAAQANARRATALAEMAERAVSPLNGLVVFAAEFIETCTIEERSVFEAAMLRLGYRVAPQSAVTAMVASLTEEEVLDKEQFSARWRDRLAPPECGERSGR